MHHISACQDIPVNKVNPNCISTAKALSGNVDPKPSALCSPFLGFHTLYNYLDAHKKTSSTLSIAGPEFPGCSITSLYFISDSTLCKTEATSHSKPPAAFTVQLAGSTIISIPSLVLLHSYSFRYIQAPWFKNSLWFFTSFPVNIKFHCGDLPFRIISVNNHFLLFQQSFSINVQILHMCCENPIICFIVMTWIKGKFKIFNPFMSALKSPSYLTLTFLHQSHNI